MIRIAVFADIHGKILLPFKMVDAYQKAYKEKIDLILQCGDLGIFPDITKLDKATIRHAKRDNQELGFARQFQYINPSVSQFLDELNIDMICVRGNHEDHDFLDEKESQSLDSCYPIDCYHRVYVCKSGMIQTFRKGEEEIVFMGIGRIGDRKGRSDKRFLQDYEREEIKKSLKQKQKLDLLITHDVSSDMTSPGFGMEELRPVLNILKPAIHFYGHTGEAYKMIRDMNDYTYSVKIKELEFNTSGMLEDGCMLILENEYEDFELKKVETSFLKRFSKYNWTQL
ncbi:MAG: metallophosphoesterase [Tannerella sp.]|jgi:Icc-related predicted phosphoesterase|nr:metallophosphoesterase [Tannerella sp.]